VTSDAGSIQRRAGLGTTDYLLKTHPRSDSLADVLERVLDKGIVIVGDIQIRLLDIELLTIKLRLMVASVERAREMGINWWESDDYITRLDEDVDKDQLADLTQRLETLEGRVSDSPQVEPKHAGREEEARGRS
jgi:Gas vesicle protein